MPGRLPEVRAPHDRRGLGVRLARPRAWSRRRPNPRSTIDADVAALLDSAEDIVNAAGLELLDEQNRKAGRKKMFRKRKKR